MTETKVKHYLYSQLANDFTLKPERSGVDPITGQRGRIDFLAYPKQDLINAGFVPQWFGIECKYSKPFKLSDLAMLLAQAATYRRMEYPMDEKIIGLPFVLIFTNMQVYGYKWSQTDNANEWRTLLTGFQYLNVGEVRIEQDYQTQRIYWDIRFGHMNSPYFSSRDYKRGHGNHGLALYVGNASAKRTLTTDFIQDKYYKK